jgi:hypothetical protein
MLRFSLVCLVGLSAAAPVGAGSWADGMFEELVKDFGTVPRGPTLTHTFRFTNTTAQPIHISGIRVSCGCVSAAPLQHDIAPGKTGAIQAQMDTRRFSGSKSVTVYVQFDRPQWEEVRLWVQANARDDLTVSPDTLSLGQHKRGTAPSGSTTISFLGNDGWQIVDVQRETNYIKTELKELRRQGGEVAYQLTASLREDAPVGKWYTDLWVRTNNSALPRVRVPLTVEIQSALSVSPSTVVLGQVKPGAEAERRVIVRGTQPFKITSVKGTDDILSVKDTTDGPRPVHVLTVKLKPKKAGEQNWNLKVQTDLKDEGEVEFQAKAEVVEK